MEPPFYRTSFAKHLHSLARSNYFAQRLDWDDIRFLEYVKKTGVANGSVPGSNAVLLEELEFWRGPYTIQPNVDRHFGRRPIPQETPEQFAARQARSNRWHAQRIIRENERAIAAAELAREQREHEAALAKKKAREVVTDAEWEAAAPEHAPFGGVKGRHYVPQWKLDDNVTVGKQRARRKLVEDAKAAMRVTLRKQAEEKARIRAKQILQEMEAEKQLKIDLANAAMARELKAKRRAERVEELEVARAKQQQVERKAEDGLGMAHKAEQDRRLRVIEEARETVRRIDRELGQHSIETTGANYSRTTLEHAVMTLLNSTPGQVWTPDEMMRALGGCTREFLDNCLQGMVRSGRLRKMDKP